MEKDGKYIYCIIKAQQDRNFGPIGIGDRGDEVVTIGYEDLSMVISSCPMTKFVVSRDNILAHEKVTEEVMKEFTVLPVRFCTIASSADEIRELLDRRNREFKSLLTDLEHKMELGVKAVWKNMDAIFDEIIDENEDIRKLKAEIEKGKGKKNTRAKAEVGKMVEEALRNKKEKEAERIMSVLRRTAFDYKLNRTFDDRMFLNAAFLVDMGREKEFDNIMDDLGEQYKARTEFTYVGPLPPYNFVNIAIYPEDWER